MPVMSFSRLFCATTCFGKQTQQRTTFENNKAFDGRTIMTLHFGRITLPAPAKLNLMLHVTGRRGDGYHNLQTLFHFLDFCDELTFTSRADGKIELRPSMQNIDDSENLVFRAAKLLQHESGTEIGATVRVTKRIPIGGGLGGGSSNAATTLVGLNQLWKTGLSRGHLQALGVTLGADVPIFIFGLSAWAEGIGDKLSPVVVPERWYVVVTPPCRVSTAEIFAHRDLVRNTPATSPEEVLTHGGNNDCQALVQTLYPGVHEALWWLSRFAEAQMTGTGSSVFATFSSHVEAEEVCAQLPSGMTGFVSRGLNVSPLYQTGRVSLV